MKLKFQITLLLAASSLCGCSLFGFGEDPEPLGPPTQVAFSLYASPSVNPNPNAPQVAAANAAMTASAATQINVDAAGQPLYQINLTGANQLDLVDKLNLLLEQLQTGSKAHASAPLAQGEAIDAVLDVTNADGTQLTVIPSGISVKPVQVPHTYDVPLAPHTVDDRVPTWVDTAIDASQQSAALFNESVGSPAPEAVSTPITFKVLQLKDDSLFLNADHDLLSQNLKKALGKTFLEDDDYILLPGQFKFIDYAQIHEDTRYLAVFANFHDQNGATWKQVLRLEPNGHKYALLVTLNDNAVAITEEHYRQPKPRPIK